MKDNFSAQSDIYAKYRPSYPQELFDFILKHIEKRNTAWDCATGNGQTAKELAKYFDIVFATDNSQKQIDNAVKADNIHYSVQPAEQTTFKENTFDLITISQALHWFDTKKFYAEVKRVAKKNACIAAWVYPTFSILPEIDEIIEKYDKKTVGPYWDYERKFVDEKYATLPFPFKEIETPIFRIEKRWTMDELKGYLNSWSALQKFIKENHYNPVDRLMQEISSHWQGERMKIIFPLYLRMGRIEK